MDCKSYCLAAPPRRNDFLGVHLHRSPFAIQNYGCDQTVMKGVRSADNCYLWTSVKALVSRKDEDAELWDKKLGHTNYRNIQQLLSKEAIRGLPTL
ncbi:hypothetical protein LIER_01021 [Lithospermum erythrorhizon]|uniref:GAG-pre-integrase domain-containing protein n=1 Tax=Lithospermum erythrorhizon TaxID=34254 RepID=A0AAV3NLV6_LITER